MSRLTSMTLVYGNHSSGKSDRVFKAWKLFGVWWSRHGVFRTSKSFILYGEKKVGWKPPKESVATGTVDYVDGTRFQYGFDTSQPLSDIVGKIVEDVERHNENIRTNQEKNQ
ncbi:hypothetical protein HOT31_gp024 [Microbacterium phage Hendrix]|uniref:Uncharacterized protein n=1 Tax=Microbacterium phage Hendrix TaxID=2182341 RepID=A0A2U8UU36_9CAUD|nr:hypothetical protein HOT31_gp024 [Microbacterium phage Hendrix]AWN07695.1 hypothetical protein PBI_HENDRIX_24 [Microbacterium phage Hendrix]